MTGKSSELELIKEWYRYNSYVRKKYLASIFDDVSREERYKDRGASYPSVVDIFAHILDAYRFWFIYVYEDRVSEIERLRGKIHDRNEFVDEEKKVDKLIHAFLGRLKPADLQKLVAFRDVEEFRRIKLRDMLWHMVEEVLQHRGELNALFWQMDLDPPVTGWNPWDEESEVVSEEAYEKLKGLKRTRKDASRDSNDD